MKMKCYYFQQKSYRNNSVPLFDLSMRSAGTEPVS